MIKRRLSGCGLFAVMVTAALLWADGCQALAQADAPRSQIALEETTFVVKTWQTDGSHLTAVAGKLTYGGQPVAHAILQAGTKGRTIATEEDGSFKLLVDRSLPTRSRVRVVSVEQATLAGQTVGKHETDRLLSAFATYSVFYPIRVIRTEPAGTDAKMVKVHAQIVSGPGEAVSFFQADKYRIAGRVEDADGNPIKGAIVWIDRDRGEGFAKSTPSDQDGKYEMFYWPEEEETNLTVIVGTRRYTLPKGKVFILPRNTSVDIRIRLPREGTIIDDKPPTLLCTSARGATYTGLLAGLDVPPDVRYTITIPGPDGRFVLTVPRAAWERRPSFFETRLTKFVEEDKGLKAGDTLPSGFVMPVDQDPRITPSTP